MKARAFVLFFTLVMLLALAAPLVALADGYPTGHCAEIPLRTLARTGAG